MEEKLPFAKQEMLIESPLKKKKKKHKIKIMIINRLQGTLLILLIFFSDLGD